LGILFLYFAAPRFMPGHKAPVCELADKEDRRYLSAFILLAILSTQILSNNATAILLLPIGISTAVSLEVDPRPFMIGLCYGAGACYATPIGYKTNLFVYGPGGYRFSDYLKLGIPLSLFVWIVSSLFIPFVWPF
jgi:di/tricarboxylate transporter